MSEKQWFYDLTTEDSKEDRAYMRLWVGRVLALTVLLITTVYATGAYAEPLVRAEAQGIVVTIYDEPCRLTGVVANLPARATWNEQGKTFEGCAAANPQLGVVVLYFKEDKSVAAMPLDLFVRVTGV